MILQFSSFGRHLHMRKNSHDLTKEFQDVNGTLKTPRPREKGNLKKNPDTSERVSSGLESKIGVRIRWVYNSNLKSKLLTFKVKIKKNLINLCLFFEKGSGMWSRVVIFKDTTTFTSPEVWTRYVYRRSPVYTRDSRTFTHHTASSI